MNSKINPSARSVCLLKTPSAAPSAPASRSSALATDAFESSVPASRTFQSFMSSGALPYVAPEPGPVCSNDTAPTVTTATTPETDADLSPIALDVPWYSQFVDNGYTPGNKSCFDSVTAMAADAGTPATVNPYEEAIEVGTGKDAHGRLVVDADQAAQGRDYIDSELEAGRPVVVGVSDKPDHQNRDGLTNHFVVITGRGTDDDGQTFYTFNDPGTRHEELGSDARDSNRFSVDADSQLLYRDGAQATGSSVNRRYEVAMIRTNAESADDSAQAADGASAAASTGDASSSTADAAASAGDSSASPADPSPSSGDESSSPSDSSASGE